jgi:DNA-directed RNA polymerase subunit N (RpoN/RPB10)
MEKKVTVSYQEYQALVEKVQKQKKMLEELHKGSVIIKRCFPGWFISDDRIFENDPHLIVLTTDDAVNKIAKELDDSFSECSKNIDKLEKDIDNMYKDLCDAKDQKYNIFDDLMKIPAFVRRLFGVK